MSVEVFCYRLGKTQVRAADKKWMPLWLEKYASTSVKTANGNLVLTRESVLHFLVKRAIVILVLPWTGMNETGYHRACPALGKHCY